jgi:hypothetical protein
MWLRTARGVSHDGPHRQERAVSSGPTLFLTTKDGARELHEKDQDALGIAPDIVHLPRALAAGLLPGAVTRAAWRSAEGPAER